MKNIKIWNNKLFWISVLIFVSLIMAQFKILELPRGGSVTYCGMLVLYLVAYFYGPIYGMGAGFLYGTLKLLVHMLVGGWGSAPMVDLILEYCIAYAVIGIGGILHEKKHGLQTGYCLGVFCRFLVHLAAGVLFYASPEKTTAQNLLYSAQYNGGYLFAEWLPSFLILCIPPVIQAVDYLKFIATTDEEEDDLEEF